MSYEYDTKKAMEYSAFREYIVEKLPDYLGEEFADYCLNIIRVNKNNSIRWGIIALKKAAPENSIDLLPTIYLGDYYSDYNHGKGMEEILVDISNMLKKACRQPFSTDIPQDVFSTERIFFRLINKAGNEKWLKNRPHRDFIGGLVIIYALTLGEDISCEMSNVIADLMELNEEQLYAIAYENTKRIYPAVCQGLGTVVNELFGFPTEEEEILYVLSNKPRYRGANQMIYTENFKAFNCDCYILPSSVDEVMVLPIERENLRKSSIVDMLSKMVMEVNQEIDKKERLSNQVFFYSNTTGDLSVLTHNVQSVIDTIV